MVLKPSLGGSGLFALDGQMSLDVDNECNWTPGNVHSARIFTSLIQ
jgi:hypothetical protein